MNTPEKVVYIKRKQTFIEESNADPEVVEYFGMAFRAVGSYYKQTGKQFGTGLSREEEEILMPEVIGYDPDNERREFRKGISDFYRSINTKIPAGGLRLNIALKNPEEELSVKNLPLNIRDYIIFKHAASHPETAKNYEEAEMYQHKRFYMEDTDHVLSSASDLSSLEDDARLEYYKINDDESKVAQMLTLLGVSTRKMKFATQQIKLKEFTTIATNQTATLNESKLNNFIEVANDKRLHTKYEIEQMISIDVLERIGQRILIKETGDLIGDDLVSSALWFEDKGNTQEVNVLKARYKEFGG